MKRESIKTSAGFDKSLMQRGKGKNLEPVIFKNAVSEWPAVEKWTPEYFAKHYGDISVETEHNLPNSGVPYAFAMKDHFATMTVSELVKKMCGGESCYLSQEDFDLFDGCINDYDFNNFVPSDEQSKVVQIRLWLGNNTRSGLHFDVNDNFLTQIYGSKKIFLVAPSDSKNLYPFPDVYTKSQIDLLNFEESKFPKFETVTVYEGTISPGDILLIPKGWWHLIYAPEASISISCWFGDLLPKMHSFKQMCYTAPKSFLIFLKDFIYYGILRRPFERRLYSGGSAGLMAYVRVQEKLGFMKDD